MLKRVLLSLAALLAAGAALVGVFIDRAASAPGLKPRLEAAASAYLGRPLTIDSLEWRRWPSPALVAAGVRLYEDPLKTRTMVESRGVEARVALLSLFKLAAGVTELRFISPSIHLRRDRGGEWNAARVVGEIAARPDEPARAWGSLAFNWFVIEGGTVTVADDAGSLGGLPPIGVDGAGKLRLGASGLHFPFELSGRLERSAASVEVRGDLGGSAPLTVAVKNGEPSLAGLAWPAATGWSGRWDGTLQYDDVPSPRWRSRVRAAPLVLSTATPRLDSVEWTGDSSASSGLSFSAAAVSSATDVEAQGSFKNNALDLDLKSSKADVGVLLGFVRAVGSAAPSGQAGSLALTISADELRYGAIDVRDVSAVVRRSTGPYVVERLGFLGLGGRIEAGGSYLPSGGDAAVSVAWKTSGVGVADLFLLAGSSREAAGVADTEGSLQTGLGDRFLPALTGTVKLDLKNGWFGGMPGLLKVLARLNLATLFTEAAGRRRARIPFDETRGSVRIEKGRVTADAPLVLENKTLQLAFMGSYDIPSRTVDGKVVVNFLTVTDEIIGLIPGVRDILLGDEKGLVPIWVKVKGKADDPEIEVLSARTIALPVWNTLGNILRLPKTLFKKLNQKP